VAVSPQPPPDEHDTPDMVAGIDERPQRRREWAGGLRSVVLPVLVIVAIVGAVWYLQRDDDGGGAGEAGTGVVALPAAKNPTGKDPSPEQGRAAPDFVLKTLDGQSVRLSDLRGQVVLINFWATWCGPCRQEVPELVRVYSEQKDRGLTVVAVDLQEADNLVRDFTEEFGMTFPVVLDRSGEVAGAYRVRGAGLPTTIFVDRDGVIRTVKLGGMSAEYLRGQLATLLN
jgi:cytochrome c biogenesis protein CcmG, thiol:disulfide interchange protein DsbE